MSIPTSPVDICNLALDRLGQAPISNIDNPSTREEKICARAYDPLRRELLRGHTFNFSKKYVVLTADAAATPAFGYSSAYKLPNDWLRNMALGDSSVNGDLRSKFFDMAGQYIYTDYGDSTGLKFTYVFDETDVNHWDVLFVKYAWLGLAMDMATKFTLKPSFVASVERQFLAYEVKAKAVSSQEKPPRRIETSKLRDRRRLGSIFRDNRFV